MRRPSHGIEKMTPMKHRVRNMMMVLRRPVLSAIIPQQGADTPAATNESAEMEPA